MLSCFRALHLSRASLSQWSCARLPDRALLKVSGPDSAGFLQGLMTNDIEELRSKQSRSLYCMFLNTQGRVLFDALIYRDDGGDQGEGFFLDIDQKCSNLAKKHLSMYKIRRKVAIDIDSQHSVFGTFNKDCQVGSSDLSEQSSDRVSDAPEGCDDGVKIFPDPRLRALGNRLLIDEDRVGEISAHLPSHTNLCSAEDFIQYRCLLGVTEGAGEILTGKTTPLEYNLDYLHGVSFHKGCYLGQELTARTHHTGIVRKRILPLRLAEDLPETVTNNLEEHDVLTETGKKVGKVKRVQGKLGLGLLRLKETFGAEKLTLNGITVEASKPAWWPTVEDKN